MGMPVVVDVRDDDVDEQRSRADVRLGSAIADATFSTYKEDSEISRLNRGELALAAAHPDVREVLDRCEALRFETNGYFDMRAATADAIDPSGLVKGWAVDRAASILDEAGDPQLRRQRRRRHAFAWSRSAGGIAGASASSTHWTRTPSPRSSRRTISQLRRQAHTRAATM